MGSTRVWSGLALSVAVAFAGLSLNTLNADEAASETPANETPANETPAIEPAAIEPAAIEAAIRRPVALQLDSSGQFLYVANRRAGTISVISLADGDAAGGNVVGGNVVGETPIGRQLSDLERIAEQRYVATDEAAHELIVFEAEGPRITVLHRVPTPRYPVSVAVQSDGSLCSVAGLWSRRVALISLASDPPAVVATLDLPFAPREQLLLPDRQRLVVADSFGGRLGVVDLEQRRFLHVREFPAHNIRGLGRSSNGQMLIIAHQMLNELAHSVRNDVHWGLLMSNDLRWLRVDAVLSPDGDIYQGAHMHPLGGAGSATGDPAGLIVCPDGTVVVSLGGVGEVAVGREDDFSLTRLPAGRRPTALATTSDGSRAFVANTFADTVSIIDVAARRPLAEIRLGPESPLSEADRGEHLFYDARLSHDAWMSCNSCHSDGHMNGLMNDNLSDASFGAPKRVLSLLGKADTAPFAWDASAPDLPTQIRNSIHKTMQSDRDPKASEVAAIAAFLATLEPPPSISAARDVPDDGSAAAGERLFASLGCVQCHTPPLYTSSGTYDVGLKDELGRTRFNPPSLRGVSQRGPYFHDNRAPTLESVFRDHAHQLTGELTEAQLKQLLAFLNRL